MSESIAEKKLEGKVVIVTGGASGIGEATSRLFAEHGARMVVIADIQDDLGQQVATSIGHHRATYHHCDVTDESQVKSLIDTTLQNYGRLDVMFSNAGVLGKNHTILDLDLEEFDAIMSVNVRGMAAAIKHAARAMVDGGVKGSIVCTASVVASIAAPRTPAYGVSKHAVLGLMRSASNQLGKYGIRVNCVSPSGVATPMACVAFGLEQEEMERTFAASGKASLEGVVLKASDIAKAALFLASDDSAFVTGHNLVVDGGLLSR